MKFKEEEKEKRQKDSGGEHEGSRGTEKGENGGQWKEKMKNLGKKRNGKGKKKRKKTEHASVKWEFKIINQIESQMGWWWKFCIFSV